MSLFLVLGLGMSAVALDPADLQHRTQLEHAGSSIDVQYQTQVSLVTRQIGTPTKAGTPSTLRCLWRADVGVAREARHGTGVRLSRGIGREGILEGSRPGWCAANRKSIAREVASRAPEVRTHVAAIARDDESVLRAELEGTSMRREG